MPPFCNLVPIYAAPFDFDFPMLDTFTGYLSYFVETNAIFFFQSIL